LNKKQEKPGKTGPVNMFILQNVRPMGGALVDVLVRAGVIQEMQPGIKHPDGNVKIFKGEGQLMLPGLVNAHAHIDKNLLGVPWQRNETPGSSIAEMMANDRRVWKELGLSSRKQSRLLVREAITAGTTHMRSHVDIEPEYGAGHFEEVLVTREEFKEQISLQLVAFPQGGLLTRPGVLELMKAALNKGFDCVGGVDPSSRDRDPVKHLDTVFELAERYGSFIDIHLHEPGMLGAFAIELIAERTRALGMQDKVTISHAFCLGMISDAYLEQIIELLLENRITIMSASTGGTPIPPLKRLQEAGVSLCCGTDGIRDMWGPYNKVDMLDRVKILGYRSRFKRDDEIEMLLDIATYGGAGVLGDANYGLEVGKQADFIVLPGETPVQAVIDQPRRTFVFKRGHLVAANGEYLDS